MTDRTSGPCSLSDMCQPLRTHLKRVRYQFENKSVKQKKGELPSPIRRHAFQQSVDITTLQDGDHGAGRPLLAYISFSPLNSISPPLETGFFLLPMPHYSPRQILWCVLAISVPSFNIFLFLFWYQWLRAKYVNRSLWDTQNLSSQHRWCSILIRGEVSEYGGRQIL